jgi:hypothetical protein
MKRLGLRFPNWSRLSFSLSFLFSLITGVMWFYLDGWGEVEGEFGPEKHPWISTLAKMHGAGAFVALMSFGMIFSAHLPAGWRMHRSRKSGLLLLADVALIVISAWGLYYAGSDELREGIIYLHLASGADCLWPC